MNYQNSQLSLPILDLPVDKIAVADKRYINTYYWSGKDWYLVKDSKKIDDYSIWMLRKVDEEGKPLDSQSHQTTCDLRADKFADRPFKEGESTFEWFCRINPRLENPEAKYQEYLSKLRHCCSYDALIRIGLREPCNLNIQQHRSAATKAALAALFSGKQK